jgi:hypothetical protein
VTFRPFPPARAAGVAAGLDLGLDDAGICFACLSFVSMALDEGNPARITGQLRSMTPILWSEGLAEPALAAARTACKRGMPDAAAALADLESRGGRSAVARAIVRRLAAELADRVHTEARIGALARPRLRLAPPELN